MKSVIIYTVDGSGQEKESCRLFMRDGKVKAVGSKNVAMSIARIPLDSPLGEITVKDGERFLRKLRFHYSGHRLRAGKYQEQLSRMATATKVDWQPYDGPKGGKGWVNPNNPEDVRYQDNKPSSSELKGEQKTGRKQGTVDPDSIRVDYHMMNEDVFSEIFAKHTGVAYRPQDYAAGVANGVGIPSEVEVNTTYDGFEMRFVIHSESGVKIATVIRSFHETGDEFHIEHGLLRVENKGKGVGKKLLRNMVDEYRRLGIESVYTEANINMGSYAWAKYGFKPDGPIECKAVASGIEFNFQRHMADGLSFTKDEIKVIETAREMLLAGDGRGIWLVADLARRVPPSEGMNMRYGLDDTIGKKLLFGKSWNGSLSMTDEESMEKFNNYVK